MSLSAWRKWWRRPSTKRNTHHKKPQFRKCFLEILEDRTLLSNTYTVNLATDTVINTGQQSGPNSGDLRWCIEQADLNPGSTIQFDPTVFPATTNTTISLSQGELQIAASMSILGPGSNVVTVSGTDGKGGGSRVFDITSSLATVTIAGLTITNGNAAVTYTPVDGNQGGDIFNGGNLTLQNDIVNNGFSIGNIGGPTGRGGAIFNAEGAGNTVLTLENTIVENSIAQGVRGGNGPSGYLSGVPGGNGGPGKGGGIYNDIGALLIVEDGSQIVKNTALGGDGGSGGNGLTIGAAGAPGGNGANGGNAGLAEGGGIYNAGSVQLNGTSASSILLSDNVAQGGKGGTGGNGGTGQNGARGGNGGNSGSGGSGGFAEGGAVYNTGSAAIPGTFTLQYINFLGDQAIGGAGNNAGIAGNAGNGTKANGGTGGQAGNGAPGGIAQGGAIYTAWGALTVPNTLFGLDANGVSNQALGGAGGNGGPGGNGGNSSGGGLAGGNPGGPGGVGGSGGNAGFAKGGAVANVGLGGNVAFTNTIFDSSLAKGGVGGNGNTGGTGGAGAQANEGAKTSPYSAGLGGLGATGGNSGSGGTAVGGGVFNAVGTLSISNGVFLSNQALAGSAGAAGAGGVGGIGGERTSKSFLASSTRVGGVGGVGGNGGAGGNAQGGGFYNLVGSVTVLDSSFKAKTAGGIGNEAVAGSGGAAGNGGNGGQGGDNGASKGNEAGGDGGNAGGGGTAGNAGLAEGGAGGNQGGNTFLSGDIFTSSLVQMGTGGAGGNGGTGGNGGNSTNGGQGADGTGGDGGNASNGGTSGPGNGGAIDVTASNLTVTNSTFGGNSAALGNQIVGGAGGAGGTGGGIGHWGHTNNAYVFDHNAGNGGRGGDGASVYGGALSASGNTKTIQITSSTFTFSAITSGAGGAGGQAGLFSFRGSLDGINGQGGNGGLAQGGAVSLSTPASQSATLNNVTVASSSATASAGGAGAINFLGSVTIGVGGNRNGFGSAGGNGGSVQGVGLADVNYNLTIGNNSSFNGGVGQAGKGGTGGTSSVGEPFSWQGGAGGNGGSVLGGGVLFSHSTSGSLNFTFNGGSASGNSLAGGVGGNGGFAGASGSKNVTGGAGGAGGRVQGGGIYILAGSNSVNNTALSNLILDGNGLVGGTGGVGGAGFNAIGGNGGNADGGGVYNSSSNPTPSSLSISSSTLAGNQMTGGIGGDAGSGTTPNGGAGGAGGAGGNVEGAGLYNGDNTPLTVINSTFGGGSTNSTTPNANANILSGSRGGRGGDAGTPAGVAKNNGGPGGAGSSLAGGNVYIAGNAATFVNDTLVFGQATSPGIGGAGGSGAGSGGLNGAPGANGTGNGGGYFANAGSTDKVGNTIIALNSAATAASADVAGTFTSLGNNILGSNAAANGFTKSGDQLNATAAQLNLGPLMNNGGPTLTDALINIPGDKSIAIDAGGNTLVTSTYSNLFGSSPTDQRGPGFPRIDLANNKVDVGAFEFDAPTIAANGLSPNSAVEQGSSFTLTITGTGFMPGAIVNWNFTGSLTSYSNLTLTPTSVSGNQITVVVPAKALPDEGTVNVSITEPDGSGVSGETLTSAPAVFTITEGSSLTLSNPGNRNNNEGKAVSVTITSSDPDTTFQATGLPPGLSINATTGVISGTIDPRGAGIYTVTVNGIDDGIVRGSTSFTWTVNDTTPPTLTSPGNQNNNEGDSVTLAISAVDADAGTFTATGLPTGLSISASNGLISGTIDSRAAGTYNVTVSASDNSFVGSTSFTWTVADTTPPSVTNPGNQTNNEGDKVSLAISAVDADSFSATGLPTGLSINANTGVISGTIDPYGAGSYSVTVIATDNGYPSTPATTFTWTVNDTTPPTLTSPGTQTNNEGDNVNVAISSVDADAGSFTALNLPTGLSINATTGVISGTIDSRAAGTYNVTVSATDGTNVGSTNFTWTVNDTTPPAFGPNPGTQNNNEGASVSLAIPATDADSFSATGLPTGLSINANTGLISGTIDKYGAGTYSVTITATDNGHSANESFTWNVADTTPPTLTNPGTQNNNEGDSVNLAISSVDGESFSISGQPTGLSINANTGVISGTIDPRGAGTYNVTVTATDGTLSTNTTFSWNVADTTPPALTSPGNQNNNEGDSVSLTISSIDADPGTFTATNLPPGLKIDTATGLISGTIDPRAVSNGKPSQDFSVTVSASDNGHVANTTFTWTVDDTTPPALTNPGTQNNNEGDTVTLNIQAVDADSFTAANLPKGLSINATTGVISGTIDSRAAGNYTVTVFADDNGNTSSVSFAWNVADTKAPTFTDPGILNNNEGDVINLALNPVDADHGTISATGLPPGLSIDSTTGVISGTIDPHGTGTYSVKVTGIDNGNTGSVSFLWNVADSLPPTLTNPGTQITRNGTVMNLAIPATDADTGSFRATGLPPGLAIDPNTGVIFGSVLAPPGTYNVTVTASDGGVTGGVSFAWVVYQMPTANIVTNVQNTYLGLFQVETVTAEVTNPSGAPVNEGIVTFHVDGETVIAPVSNGFATATFTTPMVSFDTTILLSDFFTHNLDAVYSDSLGAFGSSGASVSEPAMLLDFLLYLQSVELSSLALQLTQLQA